ncbi:hypothetical protein EMPS_05005 [Entomortierella parvispora]|uniref:F-box domain-containing protein n=1 Tax=Entomortierella parvispora TaxID=205924 RepID=A0A9P3HAC5_9FUNG|nr:hypothetical protein EMPS_05005 [Entomortierella parvispora]
MRTLSLLELPSEIISQILSLLSRRDLTVCVRVNKAWCSAFMDSLWHMVESGKVDVINALYRRHLKSVNQSPFLRNLHRIRVLDVQHPTFLRLMYEQDPSPLEPIPLTQLSVRFCVAKSILGPSTGPRHKIREFSDMDPILQILGRSTQLVSFSFWAIIFIPDLHLARLLATLSTSLEKLEMVTDPKYSPTKLASQQGAKALDIFLEVRKDSRFDNLTKMSIIGDSIEPTLLVALLEHSPKMDELNLDRYHTECGDAALARVISSVASQGWKTLGFRFMSDRIGPLTVAAILQSCATLENLRLTNCVAFDSKSIQKLLCSAPNLRRFDSISDNVRDEVEHYSLMAMDIVESTEDWVCLGLETFKCYISGVPRPDITSKNNGRPLTGIYNSGSRYSMLESTRIQRRVLAQLGRLTKLRYVTLGNDTIDLQRVDGANMYEERMEGSYYSWETYEMGSQYQCLTMSLQDGLDELRNLKSLRWLSLEKMSLRMGEAERAWMTDNWLEYGKGPRDTFWTSRGHHVDVGTDLFDKMLHRYPGMLNDIHTYDWW